MANFKNKNQLPKQKKSKTPDNLSQDILQNIFTFLPIKNAIIASTVSHFHKRSWHHNRRFLFDSELGLRYSQDDLASIIDHLFESHEGSEIKTFKLHINPIGIEGLLMRWLNICTHKDLEDLELFLYRPGFTIELSVLNELHKLKTLKLYNCAIQLPHAPSGLQFLKKLVLRKLNLNEEMFKQLIKHCNMLEIIDLFDCSAIKKMNIVARDNKHLKKLRIANCDDLEEIEIDSSTLRSIFYHGNFSKVRIAHHIQLYEALFYFKPFQYYMQSTHLEALVSDISHVYILTITPLFIEGMAASIRDGVFREAQYCFVNLRELQLFMEGGVFCNPYDIAMFLKNCPSLVKLFIDLNDYRFNFGVYWQMHQKPHLDNCNLKFTQLKDVVLRNFKFLPSELELVKIILQRALILESLVLVPPKINGRDKFKRQDPSLYDNLFRSWRASSSAILTVLKKYVEKSPATHPKSWFLWE